MDDEWNIDKLLMHRRELNGPYLRIARTDIEGRSRIYLNTTAYAAIKSEWVKIFFSKANHLYRIKLVDAHKESIDSRRIRKASKGGAEMSGAASMIKRHGFLFGYYYMNNDKVFTWKHN